MKHIAIAFIVAPSSAAAPAVADVALNGTVISTMGDRSVISLHPSERAIGEDGVVVATGGQKISLPADRVLLEGEQGQANGDYVDAYRFFSNQSAVSAPGAR